MSVVGRPAGARAYSTGTGRGGSGGGGEEDEWEEEEEEEATGAFSHLDAGGAARMVDVSAKPVTRRRAVAECRLRVGARLLRLLHSARLPKGDALCVARVAGALAAKRAADLIPLCHPLPLELARVRVLLPREGEAPEGEGGELRVRCEVRVTARTGAEMEALTGCAVAALALYDMCKSVDAHMRITDLRLLRKEGGRGGPAGAGTGD